MRFVYLHAIGFAVWMIFIESDPWPKLTLIVSLEAIFLSTFILMSQNRQNNQAEHWSHLDLQVNLLAEQEATKMLQMLQSICERLGADVRLVAEGMGRDARIGRAFLDAGLGWGGSCFPKDVKALAHMAAVSILPRGTYFARMALAIAKSGTGAGRRNAL